MKVLVIQLARFGDIYQTWPTVRALKRSQLATDVHILVREKFKAACTGLDDLDHTHTLETGQILQPLITPPIEADAALAGLNDLLSELRLEEFDLIINLTFSPLSSYLVQALATESTLIRGYTRHSDGFLNIADDTSAYFHAQVGIGRPNRRHVTHLFAGIAGVELTEGDFCPPQNLPSSQIMDGLAQPYVAVHVGASRLDKTYPASHWRRFIENLYQQTGVVSVLVGSEVEKPIQQEIQEGIRVPVQSRVGSHDLWELFPLIQSANAVIGGDSAPMHIASLVGTPALNLSCSVVNFYETAPLSEGSRIAHSPEIASISPEELAQEASALLRNERPTIAIAHVKNRRVKVLSNELPQSTQMVESIYFGGPWTASASQSIWMQQFLELNQQVERCLIQAIDAAMIPPALTKFLDEFDRFFVMLSETKNLQPLWYWYQAEKLRIGPGPLTEVALGTYQVHFQLSLILMNWLTEELPLLKGQNDADQNMGL